MSVANTSAKTDGQSGVAVFGFPGAAGHINPSLPLVRRLSSLGWQVYYISPGAAAPEETLKENGATVVQRADLISEHYGCTDGDAELKATADYGVDAKCPEGQTLMLLGSRPTAKMFAPFVAFLRSCKATLVVYCPVFCQPLLFAARTVGVTAVSLLTVSGPGYLHAASRAHLPPGSDTMASHAGMTKIVSENPANIAAMETLRKEFPDLTLNTAVPLCRDHYAPLNIVTTTELLADPLPKEDAEWYSTAGVQFAFVGPILGGAGEARVAGQLTKPSAPAAPSSTSTDPLDNPLDLDALRDGITAGRPLIYISMGTVVTGDNEEHGWAGTSNSALTGRELCHAVYRAVFAEFGGDTPQSPLIVLSVGAQPDAIDGVVVPKNAICRRRVPQVDLLRLRPRLFVTNGGQNSFMEALTEGVPMVVCPGFGDQPVQAAKAVSYGIGAKVTRPGDAKAAAEFGAIIQQTVSDVFGGSSYAEKATAIGEQLRSAGGVDEAVRLLINAAQRK